MANDISVITPPADIGGTLRRAARLDLAANRTVAAERRFGRPALVIVSLSAVSHAGLGFFWATSGGWAPIRSIVPAALSQFVLWLGVSLVAFALGRVLGSRGSPAGVLRAVGVAWLPAILYVAGVYPPLLFVMGAWWIAATYVALRAALSLDASRSIAALAGGGVAGYAMAGMTTITVLGWLTAAGYG